MTKFCFRCISFPSHSSNELVYNSCWRTLFIQIRPFWGLYSFLYAILQRLVIQRRRKCSPTPIASRRLSPTSAPIVQIHPAHRVTPGRSLSINHIKETKDNSDSTPNSTFLTKDVRSPIHFFQPAVTRSSNPDALTCRLDEGVLSLSTKEKQKRKMLAQGQFSSVSVKFDSRKTWGTQNWEDNEAIGSGKSKKSKSGLSLSS